MKPTIPVFVFRDFVNGLDLSSLVKSFTTDENEGTTTLIVENTFHARDGLLIQVDGFSYEVVRVDYCQEAITINAVLVEAEIVIIPTPFFIHGTYRKTNNELNALLDESEKVPMIYLHEVIDERWGNFESSIDVTASFRFFLLDSSPQNGIDPLSGNPLENTKTTQSQYANIIQPLSKLFEAIRQGIRDYGRFGEIDYIDKQNHVEWGVYTQNKGHERKLFDMDLTGMNCFVRLPIYKCNNC